MNTVSLAKYKMEFGTLVKFASHDGNIEKKS